MATNDLLRTLLVGEANRGNAKGRAGQRFCRSIGSQESTL